MVTIAKAATNQYFTHETGSYLGGHLFLVGSLSTRTKNVPEEFPGPVCASCVVFPAGMWGVEVTRKQDQRSKDKGSRSADIPMCIMAPFFL